MANTYSSRPFITLDGKDDNGVRAEVKVVTGFGIVTNIESSTAGKAFKVSFTVENTKYSPAGWVPDGSEVLAKLKESQEREEPIHFRIETRRKPDIDRTLPIEPLTDLAHAKDSIFKGIAAVKFEADDNWTMNPNAVTNMAEDPKSNGNGLYSANNMSPDELNTGGTSTTAARNYGGLEPAPYISTLKDGSVNPGSIAASVPLNLLSFVAEWDRDHEGDALAQVGEKKRGTVAKAMLLASNELQMKIWDGKLDAPDLGAGSHTRARALVFEVTRAYFPLSAEVVESKDSLLEWKNNVVEKSLAMWKWSISEVEALMKTD